MEDKRSITLNFLLAACAVAGLIGLAAPVARKQYGDWRVTKISHVSEMRAVSLDGEPVELPAGGAPTLYLVFSPSCRISARLVPTWKEELERLDLRGYRVVGLTFDSESVPAVRKFSDANDLGLDVYRVPSRELEKVTGIDIVPSIFTTDAAGRVLAVRKGRPEAARLEVVLPVGRPVRGN